MTSSAHQIYRRFQARASRDDEYRDWAGYRAQLTDFVIDCTLRGGSLLILGAGKCSDLDLEKLANHCGTITLSDYRPETVTEAFKRYGLIPSDRLRFAASDYVGIPDQAYIEYTDLLLQVMQRLGQTPGRSLEEIAGPQLGKLTEGLERIYKANETYRIDLGSRTCDNAVIAGVHSQLNNSFRGIFQYALKSMEEEGWEVRFPEELNAAIFEVTRKHTSFLVDRFNEAVFSRVSQGLVYGYEKNIIYTPAGAPGPVMGTVDGARQAGEAIRDLPLDRERTCLWPLSRRRNIKFEMSLNYIPAAAIRDFCRRGR